MQGMETQNNLSIRTLVNDTNGGGAVPETPEAPERMGWYVAVVRTNCEQQTADRIMQEFSTLHRRPCEYWIARHKRVRSYRGKSVVKEVRLLPGLVFLRLPDGLERKVEWRTDVYRLLRRPGERDPYRFHDTEFYRFHDFVINGGTDLAIEPHALTEGRRVRIVGTPLNGYVATVRSVDGTTVRVAAETDIIGDACITLDVSCVEYVP